MLKNTYKVDRHQINKNHPLFNTIDQFSFYSKNLYNAANYILRQEFIKEGKYSNYYEMDRRMRNVPQYKQLMSQASQCTLQVLDRNWKSFFVAIKDWSKNKEKYLGMPKLPKYKKKDGRFPWFLKNNQTYIKDGRLYFRLKVMNGYSFKTNVLGRLISVRFIPQGSIYVMEIVYESEIETENKTPSNIIGIDLGVDNFVTMTNNIGKPPIIINGKGIKSINQYYNKQRATIQSDLMKRNQKFWSNKLDSLTLKRNNRIKNFMHHASTYIVRYCQENNIDTVVVGLNKTWKQNCIFNNITTQTFHFIPYKMLIQQLEYKCNENGINFIITEEKYTSGTSFIDNELPIKENYNKKRRIKRGLFKSNGGRLINSDVNGSLQIIKKVFPDAFSYGIKGRLAPTVINVVKIT